MFRPKQYEQMTLSTASVASSIESETAKSVEDCSSTESSSLEDRAIQQRSELDAKLEKSMKSIELMKMKRKISIEEGSTVIAMNYNHSGDVDHALRFATRERRIRTSGSSQSDHSPVVMQGRMRSSGQSGSGRGSSRHSAQINRNSDLDLDTIQTVVRQTDVRRRRFSANDNPAAENEYRALMTAEKRRQRAVSLSIAESGGNKESNCRELTDAMQVATKTAYSAFSSDSDCSEELCGEAVESTPTTQTTDRRRSLSANRDSMEQSSTSIESGARTMRAGSRRTLSSDAAEVAVGSLPPKAMVPRSTSNYKENRLTKRASGSTVPKARLRRSGSLHDTSEPASAPVESRARLRRSSSIHDINEQTSGSVVPMARLRRTSSLHDTNEGASTALQSRTRLRHGNSKKTLSTESDGTNGSGNQSVEPRARLRRSGPRRIHSIDTESMGMTRVSSQSEFDLEAKARRRMVASALCLSEQGTPRRESGSKGKVVANRRKEHPLFRGIRLSGSLNETLGTSPSDDKNNFTWTWRKDNMQSPLHRSGRSTNSSKASPLQSPTQLANAVNSLLKKQGSSTPPPSGRRSSMPNSSEYGGAECSRSAGQRTRHSTGGKKMISTNTRRTSKRSDSLLSPGARRTSRANKEHHFVSPGGISTTAHPKLPLNSPTDSMTRQLSFKKSRGSNLRRTLSSVALEATPAFEKAGSEDVVNKKDIGAIAKILKQSNDADEEWVRQKEEERQAKRSHVRARRRQASIDLSG